MIRRTVVVLDTPDMEHIHLFSVFEYIQAEMQDAKNNDRHTRANHYSLHSGQGDIQIHIESIKDVSLKDVETNLDDFLFANGNALKRINNSYVKEPAGEGMYMIINTDVELKSTINKVLPKRSGVRNVRAYIDAEKKTLEYVKREDKTVRHLGEVTEKVLGFDLTCYSEHIGNIYFLDTTSPIKGVYVSGISNPIGLLCTIEYRDAKWKENFTIQVRDRHHSDVIVWDKLYEIAGGSRQLMLEMPQMAKEVELYVYDKEHRIIFYHPYTSFVRNIHLNVGIQSKVLRVKDRNNKGIETVHDYPKFAHEKPIIIEKKGSTYVDGYFRESEPILQNETDDIELKFKFFDVDENHQEEYVRKAQQMLQAILDSASTECYICDPYFNANDFQRFIYPLKSLNVNVKILNCKEQLKKRNNVDEKGNDIIMDLKIVLREYNEKMNGQPVQCRMLTGRGQLHDRFILTDDRGWVLGSSFSEFGNRVTTINEIPTKYLRKIQNHIEKWWYDKKSTMDIENYGNNTDT